jgi:hypothetical protein
MLSLITIPVNAQVRAIYDVLAARHISSCCKLYYIVSPSQVPWLTYDISQQVRFEEDGTYLVHSRNYDKFSSTTVWTSVPVYNQQALKL